MKVKLICTNEECNEIPIIQLIQQNQNISIRTDCSSHHYKFELDEYLSIIINQDKEYNNICPEHKLEYDGFLMDYNINLCKLCECSFANKIKFTDLEDLSYAYTEKCTSLKNLNKMIFENYAKAKKENKLIAAIYLNLKYMNTFLSGKDIIYPTKLKHSLVFIKETTINRNSNILNHKFDINSKYLVVLNGFSITAFLINQNKYYEIEQDSEHFELIELHPVYEQIFLSLSNLNIRIWEISEEKEKIINKITIFFPDSADKLTFAKFSPINENLIFSVNKYKSIQIFNLEKLFNVFEINDIKKKVQIYDIAFSPKESIIGFLDRNKIIIIYDITLKAIIKIIERDYSYFSFINSDEFIIIENNIIKVFSINNEREDKTIKIETNQINNKMNYYFDTIHNLLYIFSDMIYIIDINLNKNGKINSMQFIDKIESNKMNNFFAIKILDNIAINGNIGLNFLLIDSYAIYFYSIDSNKFNNNIIIQLKKNVKCLKSIFGKKN